MPEHFDDWPWRQWAQRYPQAIALHGPQRELSWRQVAAAVQRQAASGRGRGLRRGAEGALFAGAAVRLSGGA